MSCRLLSLGTATPVHQMSQAESLRMFTDIACENDKQARYARALFSKAAVENRYTSVPYTAAYNWCPPAVAGDATESAEGQVAATTGSVAPAVLAGQSPGPTTRERLEMYAQFAGDLAVESAGEALANSGLSSDEITHLVVVTCTGFDAPGVDIELIRRLQLPNTTQRIQVGFMGCHGAINGLRTARAIAGSDPTAKVLLCAVELCSLHYRFTWDPECIIGNALFADGSASMVLSGDQETESAGATPSGTPSGTSSTAGWQVVDTGSIVIPDSESSMSWRIGDHGFEMRLAGDVGDKIEENLAAWFRTWLGKRGLSMQDIGYWGVHPGGPRILNAVQSGLGLTTEQLSTSRSILKQYGNMSSPTVLFIMEQFLDQHARSGAAHEGHAILLGFGPGLVAEVALLSRPGAD